LLDGLLELARTPVRVETDPDRLRPAETPVQYCDCTKFEAITGWKPKIPLQQTLADILADWRQRVAERND
jgi:nucleoside-diphosphate-sugar epimerase